MSLPDFNLVNTRFLVLLAVLLLVAAIIYFPVLDSRFMQDDYSNLNTLELIQERGYSNYIFGGEAGPSGRPLSLLSFAIQHSSWPDHPFPFKLFNLFIHLCNGLLIWLICLHLGRYMQLEKNIAVKLALVVTSLWLLHPIHISTVLYVVQRMTLLSATFTLSGILAYLICRDKYVAGKPGALMWMGASVFFFTALAVLAKENGILLPLYIIVLESTLLRSVGTQPGKVFYNIFLLSPLVLLVIYLGFHITEIRDGYSIRHFSMYERLLTQPVVLLDYLRSILTPYPNAYSFFHDDFSVSTSLVSPPVTLFALAGIAILLGIAFVYRKKQPVVSFSIFWFFAGHVLESSFLNLELYYEHRNYLPAFGVIFLLGWFVLIFSRKTRLKTFAHIFLAIYAVLVLANSLMNLSLWRNPGQQAAIWAKIHPQSLRAQTNLADYYFYIGENDTAIELFDNTKDITSSGYRALYPYLKKIYIKTCVSGQPVDDRDWDDLLQEAEITKWHPLVTIATLDATAIQVVKNECRQLNLYNYIQTILILTGNESYKKYRAELHEIAALLSMYIGEDNAALNNIVRSLEIREKPQRYEMLIRLLIKTGKREQAEQALDRFYSYLLLNPESFLSYYSVYKSLETRLEAGKKSPSS